jgi:hypothetical protein
VLEATGLTFLAAFRNDRIDAPWLIDGPIRELFLLCMDQALVPTLKHGGIVVIDKEHPRRPDYILH